MAKCLVVGGAGFLGSTIARKLDELAFEVTVFDLFKKKPLLELPEKTKKIKGNILSEKQLSKVIGGKDFVFHFACASIPSTSLQNLAGEVTENIFPSIKVLEQCVAHGVEKIVFPSSGTVYGKWLGKPFSEVDATNPQNPYAISKLAIEKFTQFFEQKGLNYAILRPGSAFGPGQNPFSGAGAATTFLYNCIKNNPIGVFGNGAVMRDFTFSEDIAFCAINAMEKKGSQLFNVSSGSGTTILDLARLCFKLSGKEMKINFLEARETDLGNIVLDNSLAKELFGFFPTPFETGLQKTMNWLNENF